MNTTSLDLTLKPDWLALTPEQQFERLAQTELDRNGYERLLRSEQRARAEEKHKLEFQIKNLERACDKSERIEREQSEDIRKQSLDIRTLQRQIRELGQEPLR